MHTLFCKVKEVRTFVAGDVAMLIAGQTAATTGPPETISYLLLLGLLPVAGSQSMRGCPHGIMVKALDCGIIAS